MTRAKNRSTCKGPLEARTVAPLLFASSWVPWHLPPPTHSPHLLASYPALGGGRGDIPGWSSSQLRHEPDQSPPRRVKVTTDRTGRMGVGAGR